MATPIGTNSVTAIARRHIMPMIVDQIYGSNPLFFRLYRLNKKKVQGGYQIEVPLQYARPSAGGAYQGYDILDVTPYELFQNAAFDWKQYYQHVTVDGLTVAKVNTPEAVADFLKSYFEIAREEIAQNLGNDLYRSTGVGGDAKKLDGLRAAVATSGVYGGINKASNTWWQSQLDTTTTNLTALNPLQTLWGRCSKGGQHPTLIVGRQPIYNAYWGLNLSLQQFNVPTQGADEILMSGGFTHLLFNNTPFVVDDNCDDGSTTGISKLYFLNENYISLVVHPEADFYLRPFMAPTNQDAMTSFFKVYLNLVVSNCARQGAFTGFSNTALAG